VPEQYPRFSRLASGGWASIKLASKFPVRMISFEIPACDIPRRSDFDHRGLQIDRAILQFSVYKVKSQTIFQEALAR